MILALTDTIIDTSVPQRITHSDKSVEVMSMLTAALRAKLLRFARARLHDVETAEDVVQEVLATVIQQGARFHGDSSFSTYVHGILKHKIADVFRQRSRFVPLEEVFDCDDDTRPHTLEMQPNSGNEPQTPERQLELAQMRRAFDAALENLQPRTRQAFVLREVVGMDTHQISADLGISPGNLWTMLHRARKSLKAQLRAGGYSTSSCH